MTSRRSIPRRPGGALRKFGWLAAATLLALSVFAPTASAAPPSDECMAADSSFEYSVDGGPFNTVVVNGPPSEFPQNTVTVRVKAGVDLPQGCVREFSLGSFTAGGATWPESVYEHFLDIDTAALSNENRTATLEVEVPAPGCFGQTDFYTDAYTNGIFFPGSTRYEGPLEPRYPDVPTPYGKISGANGGEVECLATPSASAPTPSASAPTPSASAPTPSASAPTPSASAPTPSAPTPTPSGSDEPAESDRPTPSPSGGVEGATGTPNVTPPNTEALGSVSTPTSGSWRIVLAGLAFIIVLTLVFTEPVRVRQKK